MWINIAILLWSDWCKSWICSSVIAQHTADYSTDSNKRSSTNQRLTRSVCVLIGVKCPIHASVWSFQSGVWKGWSTINQCFSKNFCALMLVKYLICASVCQYYLVDLEMAVNTQSVFDYDLWILWWLWRFRFVPQLQSAIGWLEFSDQPSPTNLCFTSRLCDLIGVKCPIRASVLTKQSSKYSRVVGQQSISSGCCVVMRLNFEELVMVMCPALTQ